MRNLLPGKARTIWTVWADLCGVFVVGLIVSYAVLAVALRNRHVSLHTNQQVLTPVVVLGEQFKFGFNVNRLRDTDGHIDDIFQRVISLEREQIRVTRAIMTHVPGIYPHTVSNIDLPSKVTPGRWHLKETLVSDCSIWPCEDVIIETDFEVVAP